MKPWQSRSSSSVVTPGRTWGVMKSSTSAASLPALRIAAKASSGWILIRRSSASSGRKSTARLVSFLIIPSAPDVTLSSPRERQRPVDLDALERHAASIAQGLDARRARLAHRPVVERVEIGGDAEVLAIAALHDIEHDRPMSGAPHRGKLAQVARAAGRDAVRKLGCRAAPQMHVLDLDIA